jgi:hypothetical protein
MEERKTCYRCGESKPLGEYRKRALNRDGLMVTCKACCKLDYARDAEKLRAQGRQYYVDNKEKIRAYRKKHHREHQLRNRYGISVEEWEAIFDAQGRVCAICNTKTPYRTWHTDHCHDTGTVRGVLCQRCNFGLGAFLDNAANLSAAADYLRRTGA